jgi:acetate CoA/acetoacetate CoA-transferase alpha subunit
MKQAIEVEDAIAPIHDGASVMFGGFMGVGTPLRVVDEIVRQQKRGLTIIGNDTARPGYAIGKLIDAGCVKRVITSHIGTNPVTQKKMIAGEIEVELVPQGTLAERIRAAGYGLGGVLTPTGLGTLAEDGKPTLELDGRTFLVERPLAADFALIYAHRADYNGNLDFTLTARNFNPLMAMAAKTVICEPQFFVPLGVLPPDAVAVPGLLVDTLVARAH